ALIAALGADSRYLALRGIYDFAALFATAFLFSALAIPSAKWLRCLLNVLIGAGMVQAGIGIVQQIAGAERVLAALQNPLAPFFYQPNLLIEKLSDLSFNWLTFERVSPFGTFINGIDYAILLAAILCLALARMLTSRSRGELAWLAASSLLMALALALTLKGSGFLALAGGVAAIGVALAPRIPAKALALGALITTMLIALFASIDPIAGRITFLIQREQGAFGSLGRLDIWASLLDHFWQKPFFGFGLNHAVLLAEPARTMSGGTMAFVTTAPESAYVAGLVETGAVGFIALMFFLARGLGCAFQNARADARQIGIFAALVALLCGNLTVAALTTDQNGMLLGLLTGLVFAKWNPA
ncbi:MAG: O-antigen ligase family protein, partial [Chloroflexi bacterium]|nr:O-antigen ligase family protein [Chloroflexota bacterium]